MYELKVLLVDDEYHAIDMVSRLLERIQGVSLDIFTARNAAEAIHLLELGRMDMVITDIEMPGKNGIELVSYIRSRWKQCRVVILTAFSQFQYAYSALQLRVDGYLLKTESDDSILEKLRAILLDIEDDMHASANYAEKKMQHIRTVRQSSLLNLLKTRTELPQQLNSLKEMGFSPAAKNLYLITCRPSRAEDSLINEAILHELLGHYFRDSIFCMELACTDNELSWLIQLSKEPDSTDANHILGILEMVQGSCLNAYSLPLSFIFAKCDAQSVLLHDVSKTIHLAFDKMKEPESPFIYHLKNVDQAALPPKSIPDLTLAWLCKFIEENLSTDLSLVTLAALTGYNPQYLSGLFRQQFNMTLSHYITNRRLSVAQEMLANNRIPVQDIAQRLGFTSHSYFSRFIRKATGLTPQQLRSQLTEND